MKICGIDFETNGFSAEKNQITEVGAVLFDQVVEMNDYKDIIVAAELSRLCWTKEYPPQSEEIMEVTGITDLILQDSGVDPELALAELVAMFDANGWPEAFLAHNKGFDKQFFTSWVKNSGTILEATKAALLALPWLCSIGDVKYTHRNKCRVLSHLALDLGIAVDPSKLHRADDDVKLMIEVVRAAGVDFANLLARSQLPQVVIRACVPSPFGARGDGGTGRDKAKACGFGWNGSMWIKTVLETEVLSEKEALGYEVAIIEKVQNQKAV